MQTVRVAERRSRWRRPRVLVLCAVAVALLAYVAVLGRPSLSAALAERTAWATASALAWVGLPAARQATVLTHPSGFAVEVVATCTGVGPALLLVLTVIASARRTSLWFTLLACAAGVGVVLLANLARLVLVFAVGVQWPQHFGAAHDVAGRLWLMLVMTLFLAWWLSRTTSAPRPVA